VNKSVVKIYGERNCGTNYLYELIANNLYVDLFQGVISKEIPWYKKEFVKDLYFRMTFSKNLGWKHAIAPSKRKLRKKANKVNLIIVTITKNPYSYLLSMHKRPYHYKRKVGSFYEFLTTPWESVDRENNSRRSFFNPIELWNRKNASYVALAGDDQLQVQNLKYEDLLSDPFRIIKNIAHSYNLEIKREFENVNRSTKNEKGMDFQYYQNYYLNDEWRKKLDRNSIELINQYLDNDLMEYFGYEIL